MSFDTVTVQKENGEPDDDCTVWLRTSGSGSGTSPSNGKIDCMVPKQGGYMTIGRNNGTKIDVPVGGATLQIPADAAFGNALQAALSSLR